MAMNSTLCIIIGLISLFLQSECFLISSGSMYLNPKKQTAQNRIRPANVMSMSSDQPMGYSELSVREIVEIQMQGENDYTYVDIRSPEELEELVSPKGAVNLPSFETKGDWRDEDAEWKAKDSFIDTMNEYFEKDSKIIIGYKCIIRQMRTCEMLVEDGFENIFLAESNSYLQTRGLEEF